MASLKSGRERRRWRRIWCLVGARWGVSKQVCRSRCTVCSDNPPSASFGAEAVFTLLGWSGVGCINAMCVYVCAPPCTYDDKVTWSFNALPDQSVRGRKGGCVSVVKMLTLPLDNQVHVASPSSPPPLLSSPSPLLSFPFLHSQWKPQTMHSGTSSGQTPPPQCRMFLHWCQLQR